MREGKQNDNKIIITRDTDFGEVLRYPRHPGAIILRLPYAFTSKEINERLQAVPKLLNQKKFTKFCLSIHIL